MENKHVGWIILGISAVIVVIIFLFQNALKDIVASSCGLHGSSCPMFVTINQQTYLALAIVGILVVIGAVFIFSKQNEKIIVKKIKEKKKIKKVDLLGFRSDDKKIFKIVQETGTIFQADLVERSGFSKAKMSRVIDRLENKGLVERKRRGMTNVIVLKEN